MVDRDNQYSSSSNRNPNIQRSSSFGGAKLHFSYTGNEVKTSSSRDDNLRPKLPGTRKAVLPRQSTFDYSHRTSPQLSATFSPEPSRRTSYVSYNPPQEKPTTEPTSSSLYEPPINNTRIAQGVPNLYGDASSARSSLPTTDVTLTTSTAPLPFSSKHSSTRNLVEAPPAPTAAQHPKIYRSSPYAAYSFYNPAEKILPADTSHRTEAPPPIPAHTTAAKPSYLQTSPTPIPKVQASDLPTDYRSRRQTTTFSTLIAPQSSSYIPERYSESVQPRYIPVPPTPQIISGTKPHSLNVQMQTSRSRSPNRRHLTIGYSSNQFQEIEKAKEEILALRRKEEEAIKAKLQEKKRAEEEARQATIRRIEEAAKLEARRRVEETARLDAERLALEAVMRAAQPADEDEDVEKFIKNLEQRIKDSQDSKNSQGALVGRHLNQNLAKSAESLTNAPTEVDENVEGQPSNDQVSTQSAADNSEFAVLFERLNNMTTDENQNRRKYAENYYDPEDDDSELNSLNSFLTTVTEEDPDMLSINNQFYTVDPQPTPLQTCVISYIHNMVDGILSSLDKTDFANADTHKMPLLYDQDLYSNNADYNYHAISETARKFFTPQSSPVEETKNDFYNDSL